jgi:hypothetical protein
MYYPPADILDSLAEPQPRQFTSVKCMWSQESIYNKEKLSKKKRNGAGETDELICVL